MSKYVSLTLALLRETGVEVPMTFAEIEDIIGAKLPPSAYRHRPWWANEGKNHVHAQAWLEAGYETAKVDMAGRKLVFKRKPPATAEPVRLEMAEPSYPFKHATPGATPVARHPALGGLKGLLTVEPGYDLTEPAMPEWATLIDAEYGPEKP